MSYQTSQEFRDQFPATGKNPPAKIPLRNNGGTAQVYADAFSANDTYETFVKVRLDGTTRSLTVDAANGLIDQLGEAIDMAEDEQCAFERYTAEQERKRIEAIKAAKPHPRAVQPDATNPAFWIWCNDRGQFYFTYNGALGAVAFTPGSDYVGTANFNPTPANVALWTKLAYEAAQAAK